MIRGCRANRCGITSNRDGPRRLSIRYLPNLMRHALRIYSGVLIEGVTVVGSMSSTHHESWSKVRTAASVTFFRPEFDDFLYAPIGADRNEMSLTVLSALSRLNMDPWEEAAELCELPKDSAARRLASLIARLPGGPWAQADAKRIADRLIELLPQRSKSNVRSSERAGRRTAISTSTIMLICVALVLTAIMIATNLERSTQGDDPHVAASSTAPLRQTLQQ